MGKDFNLIWNGYTVCPKTWGMSSTCEMFHRIYYVYGGEASYTYRGESHPMKPGHLYLFPVFQPYSMRHSPERPLDVLWFHVEQDIPICEDVVNLEVSPDGALFHLIEALRLLSNSSEKFGHLLELFRIFLLILQDWIDPIPPLGKEMRGIVTYIDQHIDEPMNVGILARHAKMERSYFCRKFKKIFRTPPSRYITGVRMKQATKALLSGATVYAAAQACGYRDEKAFSRAFKQYMEISPARYRDERVPLP